MIIDETLLLQIITASAHLQFPEVYRPLYLLVFFSFLWLSNNLRHTVKIFDKTRRVCWQCDSLQFQSCDSDQIISHLSGPGEDPYPGYSTFRFSTPLYLSQYHADCQDFQVQILPGGGVAFRCGLPVKPSCLLPDVLYQPGGFELLMCGVLPSCGGNVVLARKHCLVCLWMSDVG